jgi:putative membrane protein
MMASMKGFLLRAIICGLGLWLADRLLSGVSFDTAGSLILAAVLLGIANAIVRPVLFFLTLPLTIVTLGLFIFIVNGLTVALVAWIIPGMKVTDLWHAVLTAVIVGIVGWIASWFIGGEGKMRPVRPD